MKVGGNRPLPEKLAKQNKNFKFIPGNRKKPLRFAIYIRNTASRRFYQRSTNIVIFVSIVPFCKGMPISFYSMNEIGNYFFNWGHSSICVCIVKKVVNECTMREWQCCLKEQFLCLNISTSGVSRTMLVCRRTLRRP